MNTLDITDFKGSDPDMLMKEINDRFDSTQSSLSQEYPGFILMTEGQKMILLGIPQSLMNPYSMYESDVYMFTTRHGYVMEVQVKDARPTGVIML